MDLRKRFKIAAAMILLIPVFAILVTSLAYALTRNLRWSETEELSAPRFLHPVLTKILTGDPIPEHRFSGVIMVFDNPGSLLYLAPEVEKQLGAQDWESVGNAFENLMELMPNNPFNISIYRYKGKPGLVFYVEEYFTSMRIFRASWFVLFILYLILFVLPVLILRRVTKPIADSLLTLEQAAREIGQGNLDGTIAPDPESKKSRRTLWEMDALENAFNNMRLELKENHERQSRIMMSISHDLKTPLTLIKGYVEALKDGMAETPEMVSEYADVIHDRTILLEERINDLIHFARLQTTDWQARFILFSLKDFLEEARDIFRNDAQIRKRRFESVMEDVGNRVLRGDRKMLFQVLENLFDNSCRYSGEEDTIRLSTCIENNRAIIIMEDSGPGVREEHIPFIFNNFFRADQGRNSRGLGVGLDSAKTIVRIHGGDIYYKPSSLGGACFVVNLPCLESQ